MYSLKGIFPEPKKDNKKNFIRENMKQLKFIQGKSTKELKYGLKVGSQGRTGTGENYEQVHSSPSNKSGKISLHVGKTGLCNSRHKHLDSRIRKGDMAEFLKRKEMRIAKQELQNYEEEEEALSTTSSGRLRDIACQTMETNLSNKLAESTKLTMLYPNKDGEFNERKGSGDTDRNRSPSHSYHTPRRGGDNTLESDKHKGRLNSISERKDKDNANKDPYLPSGYQKGVLPKYLRNRKEATSKEALSADDEAECPPGHVTLPDTERKETLRMLRNSFAELVSELNKMPVKTDTLRMKNRKMELEKQLAKLEEGIKVFSRPKVFVKIEE